MAAYAVDSAIQKLSHLLHSQSDIPTGDIESLSIDLKYFESFLSYLWCNKVRSISFEQQIEDVASRIEDSIALHFSSFEKLVEVVQDIAILSDKLKKGEYETYVDPPPAHFLSEDDELLIGCYDSILDSCPDPVGFEHTILNLKHKVMRGSSKLKYVVVCGMAGCGKTTLVKQVYPILLNFFEIHCMLTVSLNFTLRGILVCLLTGLGLDFDDVMEDSELGMSVMTHLKGKCYLLVFDNLWDSYTWNQLQVFFPNEHNRSRIVCISRNRAIIGFSDNIEKFCPPLLSAENSWKLLHDVIFTTKECNDPQLEEIGKEIAKKCEGLPLAIVSMGKLLKESERTVDAWKSILDDDDPFQVKRYDGQAISKSLYLSYDSLPYYLKFSFLYMGVLPQNHHIKSSDIFMLWIAEGLISFSGDKSLEEKAMLYFKVLYLRSMVLMQDLGTSAFRVHFVFRSLCIRQAQDEQFCLVLKKYVKTFSQGKNVQRLCIHNNTVMGFKEMHQSMKVMSHLSSILSCGPQHQYPLKVCLNFKYLKILHTLSIRFFEFPLEVLELVRLRYLAISYDGPLPTSISKLWKLEFLILKKYHIIKLSHGPSYLPMEIWNLQWLKHIQCTGLDLPDPKCDAQDLEFFKYLSELSGVGACSCTPKILNRMRNLKKLKVFLALKEDEIENFGFFHDVAQSLNCLESFKCVLHQVFTSRVVPPIPTFPTTISKLSLSGCGFPWKYTSAISVLPNLTTLKLQNSAFCGPVWDVTEGGFPRLMALIIRDLDLEEWRVKSHQFPSLAYVSISHCYNLQEFPTEFRYLPKLRKMVLYSINTSLEESLRPLLFGRQLLEDNMLQVCISKLDGTKLYEYMFSELPIEGFADQGYISTKFEPEDKNN